MTASNPNTMIDYHFNRAAASPEENAADRAKVLEALSFAEGDRARLYYESVLSSLVAYPTTRLTARQAESVGASITRGRERGNAPPLAVAPVIPAPIGAPHMAPFLRDPSLLPKSPPGRGGAR